MSPKSSSRPYSSGRPSLFNNNSGQNMRRKHKNSNYVRKGQQQQQGLPSQFDDDADQYYHHDPSPQNSQQRRTVHFNEKVTVYFNNTYTSTEKKNTYLSLNDLTTIQEDVFMTLEYMNMIDRLGCSHGPSFLCSRGLEDYSTKNKGFLKESTILRRQNGRYSVLQEQEHQRKQQQRHHQQRCNTNRNDYYYDTDKLRMVYEQYTLPNAKNAAKLGRYDSEEAFNVYAEEKQQQQQQQQSNYRKDVPPTIPRCSGIENNIDVVDYADRPHSHSSSFFQSPGPPTRATILEPIPSFVAVHNNDVSSSSSMSIGNNFIINNDNNNRNRDRKSVV